MSSSAKNQNELVGNHVRIFLDGTKWYANYQHQGKQRRVSLRTSNKKEARRKAASLDAEILQGTHQEKPRSRTISEVCDAYLAHMNVEEKAPKTLAKIDLVIRRIKHMATEKKLRNIEDINLEFVDAYRASRLVERTKKKPKPKTLLNETVIIRQVVNFALSREWLQRDSLKNLKLKKVKSGPQPCWTQEELEKILAAARPAYRNALTILAETGMRVGELKHLAWLDADFTANVLLIRPKENWKPKTGDQRAIPISPRLMGVLKSLPRRSRWVVTSPRAMAGSEEGKQVSERRLLQSLKTTLKKLGLPGHLHTFRHTFISIALANGTTEATLRSWAGHLDPDTLKTYTHVHDRTSQAEMQRLAGKKAAALPPEANHPTG